MAHDAGRPLKLCKKVWVTTVCFIGILEYLVCLEVRQVTPSWGTNDATDWARAAAEGSRKVLAADPAPRTFLKPSFNGKATSFKGSALNL